MISSCLLLPVSGRPAAYHRSLRVPHQIRISRHVVYQVCHSDSRRGPQPPDTMYPPANHYIQSAIYMFDSRVVYGYNVEVT
jgi:hypothetical protein